MSDKQPSIRRFQFVRTEDVSGVSGVGVIAEGVEFSDGSVALKWLTHTSSVGFYANVKQMIAIHGHAGCGKVEWIDPDPLDKADPPVAKKKAGKRKS